MSLSRSLALPESRCNLVYFSVLSHCVCLSVVVSLHRVCFSLEQQTHLFFPVSARAASCAKEDKRLLI